MSDEKYDENEVTLNVLNLMLNNDWEEGDKILLKYKLVLIEHSYVYLNRFIFYFLIIFNKGSFTSTKLLSCII